MNIFIIIHKNYKAFLLFGKGAKENLKASFSALIVPFPLFSVPDCQGSPRILRRSPNAVENFFRECPSTDQK